MSTTNQLGQILLNISKPDYCGKAKCLKSLNEFVTILQRQNGQMKTGAALGAQKDELNLTEICLSLRVCLVHEVVVIRVAALRVLRYLVNSGDDLKVITALGIPYLVARSLDIVLNNSSERIQAIRFCQKILSFPNGASLFPVPILRALVALALDGVQENDKIHYACLSILCELAVVSPFIFIQCGGTRVLVQNLLVYRSALLSEAILGALLYVINKAETRNLANICLLPLVAPFTDHHFKISTNEATCRQGNVREVDYQTSKFALRILLRSWNGIAFFSRVGNNELHALVESLFIEQLEVRRAVLDLISELVGLKFSAWTDEISVAVTTSGMENADWKLQGGFVVEEALSILPHLATVTVNMQVNQMALLIYCFVSNGLLDALVEVVVTSDTFISVKATLLMAEFLSLIDRYLPIECFDPSKCLPTLIEYATSSPGPGDSNAQIRQHRAVEAITVLSSVRKNKLKILPFSTFLQVQVGFAGYKRKCSGGFVDRLGELQLNRLLGKDIENSPAKLLKETGTLISKDPMSWQWQTICTVFRWCPVGLKKVEDSSWRLFLRRLVDFYKPSMNLFARLSITNESASLYVRVGCQLVEFLSQYVQNFCGTLLLDEFLSDIVIQLDDLLKKSPNVEQANWCPNKLETTLSQSYFIFIGVLTKNFRGYKILERCELLPKLLSLTCELSHEYYIKLLISSLNYGEEFSRRVLSSALNSSNEGIRVYSTQFLRVLVRLKPFEFSKWGIEFLVKQLGDESILISNIALNILEEAVLDKMFLESLISLRPNLSHHGDRGKLILVTFFSLPSGCKLLSENNFLKDEIEHWRLFFNIRYVDIVETMVRNCFSIWKKGIDGKYPKRMSYEDNNLKLIDSYLPSHLYGQLAQHKTGLDILSEMGEIDELVKTVTSRVWNTDNEIKQFKAGLWALSHMLTSVETLQLIDDANIIETIVRIAGDCPVLSIRQTAFHCLCLASSTSNGSEILRSLNWYSVPRTHQEVYPIWTWALFPDQMKEFDTISLNQPSNFSKMEIELKEEDSNSEELPEMFTPPQGQEMKNGQEATNTTRHKKLNQYLADDTKMPASQMWALTEKDSDENEVNQKGTESIIKGSKVNSAVEEANQKSTSSVSSITTVHSLNLENNFQDTQSSRSEYDGNADLHMASSLSYGSPGYCRSIIRKPIIRMPVLSDPDLYPPHRSPQGRLSLRELKVGSLDRHSFISPGELFNESKLTRANASMTSLSTPSFKSKTDSDIRGPCYMGLCLPKDLSLLFSIEEIQMSLRLGDQVCQTMKPGSGVLSNDFGNVHDSKSCLACCYKGRDLYSDTLTNKGLMNLNNLKTDTIQNEILRFVSDMISSVGTKANEQSLLRLKQMHPSAFQNLCTYSEVSLLMSRYNMRSCLRRFIQELFYDLQHSEFCYAVENMLSSNAEGEPFQLLQSIGENGDNNDKEDDDNEIIDLK